MLNESLVNNILVSRETVFGGLESVVGTQGQWYTSVASAFRN